MREVITSPEKFATWFNFTVPGAYQHISADDVRLMFQCGLIGKHNYYGRTDLETVRGILQYEQLRKKRIRSSAKEADSEPPHCKSCGHPLPSKPETKKGRPREYCARCKSSRARERYRQWRARKRLKQKAKTEIGAVYNDNESDRKEVTGHAKLEAPVGRDKEARC